jgi:hypothetical protein
MTQILGLLSGILIVISYLPYIRDILLHKTKPERASWLIWAVLGSIAFFSQFAVGGSFSLILPASETLFTVLIFVLAIKYGVGGFTRRDIIALIAAAMGLILWYFTKQPLAALIITVIIDSIGAILTVIKSYHDPESETLISWVLVATAGILATFAVGKIDGSLLLYPLYIFAANAATAVAILIGRRVTTK